MIFSSILANIHTLSNEGLFYLYELCFHEFSMKLNRIFLQINLKTKSRMTVFDIKLTSFLLSITTVFHHPTTVTNLQEDFLSLQDLLSHFV